MAAALVESMGELSLKEATVEQTVAVQFKISGLGCFELELEPSTTVRDVKKLAKEQCNIEPEHMRLIYNGRELKAADTLDCYDAESDAPVQLFFTAGHAAMVGGGGGTGGGPRNRGPQLNPFGTPVRGIPGSKSLRPSRVSGRAGGMGLIRKYGILMKRQEFREKAIEIGFVTWSSTAELRGQGSECGPAFGSRVKLKAALESSRPRPGLSLGEALWALARWGGDQASLGRMVDRSPSEPLGRNAYAIMLRSVREDADAYVRLLRHMASYLQNPGLQAAVLNSALLRLCRAGRHEGACELLRDMATRELWTPVTFKIQAELLAGEAVAINGRPSAPGRVDPGLGAHKYTKAAHHALQAPPGDPKAVLERLEHFSRDKGWLKFGAAGEKGSVIDGAVKFLRPDASVVELGTFLGYSAIRMALSLGSSGRIITIEYDPEVACLAENLVFYAGLDSMVAVWIGSTEDAVPDLQAALRPSGRADLVYMDHNQMIYHEDVQRLEVCQSFGRREAAQMKAKKKVS
ncbi:unnamed protein product [Polarella glacialis]|uniref:catechol O-methyltransferase n=1 Tax=Polarella glacialis TaxID=89957 RepID=A0A813HQX1_POLGL|nr:unnamed protein product [Polarella glacialis]